MLALFGYDTHRHLANIHAEASYAEFIEDGVLHKMGFLDLTEGQYGVPYAQILEVIFKRRVNVGLAFDVVALGLLDKEGVFDIGNVGRNGFVRYIIEVFLTIVYSEIMAIMTEFRNAKLRKECNLLEMSIG